jgi:cysteine desulfurase/selenocysteine lyase
MLKDNLTISAKDELDIEKIRKDFPLLQVKVYGKPLVYLDNGATTQKPEIVLKAMDDYYRTYNSNVHRGVHFLSQKATDAYEVVRNHILMQNMNMKSSLPDPLLMASISLHILTERNL